MSGTPPDDRSRPTANGTASNVVHLNTASVSRRRCGCGDVDEDTVAECASRGLYCADGQCAVKLLELDIVGDLIERQAYLRWMADCLWREWQGEVAAAFRDHADLLEVAHRNGWLQP